MSNTRRILGLPSPACRLIFGVTVTSRFVLTLEDRRLVLAPVVSPSSFVCGAVNVYGLTCVEKFCSKKSDFQYFYEEFTCKVPEKQNWVTKLLQSRKNKRCLISNRFGILNLILEPTFLKLMRNNSETLSISNLKFVSHILLS